MRPSIIVTDSKTRDDCMEQQQDEVPGIEARTEQVMIVTLLAIAGLALCGLFFSTERSAALERVTADDGATVVARPAAP